MGRFSHYGAPYPGIFMDKPPYEAFPSGKNFAAGITLGSDVEPG